MRQTILRSLIALLTFVSGVALSSLVLLLHRHRHNGAPLMEEQRAAAPSDHTPAVVFDTGRFTKIGELPEHDVNEEDGFSCQFIDEKVGWLVNGAKIWRTTTGGMSWDLVYSKGKVGRFDPGFIRHLKFASSDHGWMLANRNLSETRDGGKTWIELRVPEEGYFLTFDFLSDGKRGWIAGRVCQPLRNGEETANRFYCSTDRKNASAAAVFMTSDGGLSWQKQRVSRRFGNIHYFANEGSTTRVRDRDSRRLSVRRQSMARR